MGPVTTSVPFQPTKKVEIFFTTNTASTEMS